MTDPSAEKKRCSEPVLELLAWSSWKTLRTTCRR